MVNDAVRSAVLAISHLFEHPPPLHDRVEDLSQIENAKSDAMRWYCRSIREFQTALANPEGQMHTELALLSCVLLACVEFAQNNVYSALKLLKGGFQIAGQIPGSRSSSSTRLSLTLRDMILPMLARQAVVMANFGYLPPSDWFERFQDIAPSCITSMSTLLEARSGLYTCLWKAMEFISITHDAYNTGTLWNESTLIAQQQHQTRVLSGLRRWHGHFQHAYLDRSEALPSQDRQAISVMLLYYHVGQIWATSCLDRTHLRHDAQLSQFEAIVANAEELVIAAEAMDSTSPPPPFSFEMHVIAPLFFTGWRCRHPLLRRKCVALLKRAPKQESLFVADRNARALEKIIEIEESSDLATAVRRGEWDGELPSWEDRCLHVVIQHEYTDGRKVKPRLIYTRGLGKDGRTKLENEFESVSLY